MFVEISKRAQLKDYGSEIMPSDERVVVAHGCTTMSERLDK